MPHPYDVYHHPEQGYEAVKRGFSWPAFFFGMFWALAKKLILVSALLALAILGRRMLINELGLQGALMFYVVETLHILTLVALFLVPGYFGNAWRRWTLSRRGYQYAGRFEAETPDGALAVMARGRDAANYPVAPAQPTVSLDKPA